MNALRKYIDRIKPHFEKDGKFHAFRSVFDGFETFLFVPNKTSKIGVSIHDSIDSKRIMSFVVIALIPALLFGMYNIGYQNYTAAGVEGSWTDMFLFGFLCVLPKIVVSYIVGLGIEFIVAQWKNEEIQEGFLVSGILIPMIVPVECPLWILAIATAFAVIFAKEIFGGTGMNIFNVALIARAFLFFSYPSKMSGESVWVAQNAICGLGNTLPDGFTAATPLGSIGAIILLWTGIASWKTMISVFIGGGLTAALFHAAVPEIAPLTWYEHLALGGFCFGAVFMATDPVTGARTEPGKFVFGFLIGVIAILIRILNPGYPEGMMLAILLMNIFAPLIDYCVVQSNINKRMKRVRTNH